jgi:hypothetical protein
MGKLINSEEIHKEFIEDSPKRQNENFRAIEERLKISNLSSRSFKKRNGRDCVAAKFKRDFKFIFSQMREFHQMPCRINMKKF